MEYSIPRLELELFFEAIIYLMLLIFSEFW
jgi:hypothetical protein